MSLFIVELIRKKRDGLELTPEEIQFFIQSVVKNTIEASQIGAMLMAMYLNKLTLRETVCLTKSMIDTGETLNFDGFGKDILVDKHSTGGVGDKISLVLAPALAACGLKVPMISGRSLGHTGGTLDKLESIPGFQVHLNQDQMKECLTRSGCFICETTSTLAPADGVLYKIRDIVATVEEPSLVAASILSKKAAEGIGTLVVDVKFGKGSLFKNQNESKEMAKLLKEVGKHLSIDMQVILSEMNAPLGNNVGNALEVIESIKCLRNETDNAVKQLTKLLGGIVLKSKGITKSIAEGEEIIQNCIENFTALNCFQSMLISQGVSINRARDLCSGEYWKVLPKAPNVTYLRSPKTGIVAAIDALGIAKACWHMGAGRTEVDNLIDHSVGVVLLKMVGNDVAEGEHWIEVHHSTQNMGSEVRNFIQKSLLVEPTGHKVHTQLKTYLL